MGNNLGRMSGIDQETCALLCFKRLTCTHWTHNWSGDECWLKTSDSGRAKSTTGSISGPKACGGRGFSLPEVTKTAAAAMASCAPPWTSLETGCYLFREWNSSWYNARGECRQSGGHLVIHSESESCDPNDPAKKLNFPQICPKMLQNVQKWPKMKQNGLK